MEQHHPNTPNGQPPGPRRGLWTTWRSTEVLGFTFMVLTGNFFFQFVAFQVFGGMSLPVMTGAIMGVFLPAWAISRIQNLSPTRDFFLVLPSPQVALFSALLAVATILPTSFLAELSLRLTPANPEVVAFMQENLPTTPGGMALAFLAVVLAAPLAEEMIFRGLLHRHAAGMWGPLGATVVSSLVFGIVHGEAWILFGLIGVGVVLAFVFEATGSIIACWITHAVHNGISLYFMITQNIHEGPQPMEPSPLTSGLFLQAGTSAAVAILIGMYLWKIGPRTGGRYPSGTVD